MNKENVFHFIMGVFVAPLALFLAYMLSDLSQAFLFTCIVESIFAIGAKTKLFKKLSGLICKKCSCECKCVPSFTIMEFLQGCYIFVTAVVLIAAVCIFRLLPTTNKTSSPEDSRDLNKDCGIFGFFDWHDLWHFLSSFALLMGAFVVMFLSVQPVKTSNESYETNEGDGGIEMDGVNESHG